MDLGSSGLHAGAWPAQKPPNLLRVRGNGILPGDSADTSNASATSVNPYIGTPGPHAGNKAPAGLPSDTRPCRDASPLPVDHPSGCDAGLGVVQHAGENDPPVQLKCSWASMLQHLVVWTPPRVGMSPSARRDRAVGFGTVNCAGNFAPSWVIKGVNVEGILPDVSTSANSNSLLGGQKGDRIFLRLNASITCAGRNG